MRINKYLASCGVASRRKCDEIILGGTVAINGKTVTELGVDIKSGDTVTVGGKKVSPESELVYFMLNKPKGYITSASDELGRKIVLDLIDPKDKKELRLFPVGRLDYDTEGLLIITNDGDLAARLTHPRFEIEKTYTARVRGRLSEDELDKLRSGVTIDGVKTKKTRIKVLGVTADESRFELTITEGKNRQIRKMFEAVGKEVSFLKRVRIGELKLSAQMERGHYRRLTKSEVTYLKNM